MIPLLTREAVRAIDRDAIERLGVPGLVLMENAGAGATRVLLEHFRGSLARPLVLGGVGQNGGDAWVVARHLVNAGITPRVVLVGAPDKVQGDARVNLDALRAMGVSVEVASNGAGASLRAPLESATVVVDGLFGTGLDRPITGLYAEVIELVLAAQRPVLALDLPSGIDANTGGVLGIALRAVVTATFAAHKRGLHQHPGAAHAGRVQLVTIGVPPPTDERVALVELADVARVLAPRARDAHKGTNGHVLAIAGSPGKTGAAVLAGLGALRGGAGLVTLAASREARRALDQKVLELMTAELDDVDGAGSALALCAGKDAALLGPGLGLDDAQASLARTLAVELPVPCVLDADALTSLAADVSTLRAAKASRVLTPHPGEAARLLGCSTADVQADRYASARTLAERAGHVVVLKGARTVVASPEGALRVAQAGTPALGTAGTGDVLSGAVAAALATHDPFEAAWSAVELHALAGELASASDRGTLASEVAAALPRALERCRTAAPVLGRTCASAGAPGIPEP